MTKRLLQNGLVCTKDGLKKQDILIDGATISHIEESILPEATMECIDLSGKIVSAGFVDPHVHLREPGYGYKETILTGTQAAIAGGYTTVCSMPNVNPVPDTVETMAIQKAIIARDARCRVMPFASITMGREGLEVVDMASFDKIAGFSDDGNGVQTDEVMQEALHKAAACDALCCSHCENEKLLEPNAKVHKGEYAKAHQLPGISSESEYDQVIKQIEMARLAGGRYHVCHVSCIESIEAVRKAKQEGVHVTCEITPHHALLCEEDISDSAPKKLGDFIMNPPLRSRADLLALQEAMRDGTIDCIATDHAPHSHDEKSKGVESAMGVVGLETAFSVLYTGLVKHGLLSLTRLIEMMTTAPARILGIDYGLRVGDVADITVIDLEAEQTIDAETFYSKGRSTPFNGDTVYAQITHTFYQGEPVYTAKQGAR